MMKIMMSWLASVDRRSEENMMLQKTGDLMFCLAAGMSTFFIFWLLFLVMGKIVATFMGVWFCLIMAATVADGDFDSSGAAFLAVLIGGVISATLLIKFSLLDSSLLITALIMIPLFAVSLFRKLTPNRNELVAMSIKRKGTQNRAVPIV